MRLARLMTGESSLRAGARWVRAEGSTWVPVEDPYAAFARGAEPADVPGGLVFGDGLAGDFLPPCEPLLVVGIAQNGPEHHSPVQAWLKSPRTVVASGVSVTLRRDAGVPAIEGEIAVVIGKDTRGLTAANAHEYVLGVTAVNDVSSPDRAVLDPRNFEGKGGEGYTPLGPWIDTEAGIDEVPMTVRIDGVEQVSTGTWDLPSDIRTCLEYVSHWLRLGPGDVVMTGAPRSNFSVEPGALVEIEVAGMVLTTQTV
ncbi:MULTISPECIES: fumarylacetoacetate hydrolase family protein [Arthrobacter]|uniref:Fumarylacetoacetate hydrolase family protein n=2 Tax=Arthrobacter TaxID=1663 RepID=A0ABU9KI82_9MICC|nr:fumarylacetoacetate hydrolase family protein [Arthrobacter sp. YJM1]MDP5226397.1 fumarylacetoacetate hydrolase family protein [Arthrobacter sp. YJM1]